nr:hypothetical protein [Rhodovulum sp. BSW8]
MKARIRGQNPAPGVTVAAVARQHGVEAPGDRLGGPWPGRASSCWQPRKTKSSSRQYGSRPSLWTIAKGTTGWRCR